MYYRIAIQSNSVMQWLLFYQAFPRGRLRVFESDSREDLCGQLLCENSWVSSRVIPAVQFMSADSNGTSVTRRGTINAAWDTGNCQAQALEKPRESFLDLRRIEFECGAGGDHDLPYRFSMPSSMPQLLAWVNLLTRVEHGDLRAERIPVGAGTASDVECADEVPDCVRTHSIA